MELVLAQLQEEGSKCGAAPGVAHFLADSFQKNCGAVLKLSAESCDSDDEVRTVDWWNKSSFYLFLSACCPSAHHCCASLLLRQEALIVMSLLDVLCEMTSGLQEFVFLQDHPELLEATVGT